MDIIIDNRERDLIELIQDSSLDFDFQVQQLDIGDIHFVNRETKELILIIERKTYSDLSSSVTDGRYREQKQRLLHSISQNVRKIYVFEGDKMRDFHLDNNIFEGIMINTVIRDKIMIYKTTDLLDTFHLMRHIRKNMETHMEDYNGTTTTTEYSLIKVVKKENMCRKTVFKGMLSLIPQISKTISDVLYDKYENMDNFINKIKELGEGDWIKMMKVISEEKYGANQRRIGDVTSKKILLYLFHMSEEEKAMIEDDNFGKEIKKRTKKNKIEEVESSPPTTPSSSSSQSKKTTLLKQKLKPINLKNNRKGSGGEDNDNQIDISTSNNISLFSEDVN